MVALDTNVLVYAHMKCLPFHPAATGVVEALVSSTTPWCIPWPCVHEFCAVVTNPRAFTPPLSAHEAFAAIDILRKSPTCRLIAEGPGHWEILTRIIRVSGVVGGAIHDARVAAICIEHDIDEIWTVDRDFLKFPGIRVRNPLIA